MSVHRHVRRTTLPIALLAIGTALPAQSAEHAHTRHAAADEVPLYADLGDHHVAISTRVPQAQRYFDQGMRLYYGFNHAEAIRAFREAQRLDPSCAMCHWGEALAWGPNINLPMDSASGAAAYAAAQRAERLLATGAPATPRERALIAALATRYGQDPDADRAARDSAWARAIADAASRFRNDDEIAVLHAEALMNLRPWDYWTSGGALQPGMDVAVATLERVIARAPRHPGACHFYIHAVEAVRPDRAVACAERLAALMPGAGHLVHMPGHIYIRVGRYDDAIAANEHALHADETWIRDTRPGETMYTLGYYPHNFDFLAFAAMMAGREAKALAAADTLAARARLAMAAAPDYAFLQHHATRDLQMRIRFGRWDAILAAPAPDSAFLHARAMWHYAQGRALAATGRSAEAAAHLDAVRRAAADPRLAVLRLEFNSSAAVLRVAAHVLAGMIASNDARHDAAVAALRDAIAADDALTYGEPPEWSIPVRQTLGEVLLTAGRYAEAEAAFRTDLAQFPRNVWSLDGLARALEGSGRLTEALAVARHVRIRGSSTN